MHLLNEHTSLESGLLTDGGELGIREIDFNLGRNQTLLINGHIQAQQNQLCKLVISRI